MALDPARYLEALGTETAALAAAAEVDLDAPVPTCPGFAMAKLVLHVGLVHRFIAAVVTSGEPAPFGGPRAPDGPSRVGWLLEGGEALREALVAAGPERPAWSPDEEPGTTRFWYRRAAQETAVHRVDAEGAVGRAVPIPVDLAADGLEEFLEVLVRRVARDGPRPGLSGTVHLHATDADAEWMVALSPNGVAAERGHGKADLALRGSASDLLLWCWNRPPAEGLERLGDLEVAERWAEHVRL
jgi:uncharacterized protein (TIGR03083 family)